MLYLDYDNGDELADLSVFKQWILSTYLFLSILAEKWNDFSNLNPYFLVLPGSGEEALTFYF